MGVDLKDRQAQLAELMADQVGRARKRARPWRSIFTAALAVLAAGVSAYAHNQSADHKTWLPIWIASTALFCVLGLAATLGLSAKARDVFQPRFGSAHATLIRVVLVLAGWGVVFTVTLDLFGVPIERLILGGALTGVLLGIAAQQTLANLFAGIVLLLSRPFEVGEDVRLYSGPMGGEFEGHVVEIGLTYVRLETDDGILSLPNAQVLSAAAGPRTAASKGGDGSGGLPDVSAAVLPAEAAEQQAKPDSGDGPTR
jgi:small-conductance mechanosensitive channel